MLEAQALPGQLLDHGVVGSHDLIHSHDRTVAGIAGRPGPGQGSRIALPLPGG
jgi:hypothetical protein